ncbi:MAG TPA: hypothetical protein VM818_05055 [Vicinamibacterales bacterium]|jgi:hypothetical protein|nr:hypothetical protein [Vicinamibacterales bacterium]
MSATTSARSTFEVQSEREQQGVVEGMRHGNIARWVELIQAEYTEMPGLQLTKRQVQRLWGLDEVTCELSLQALENLQFLRRTPTNVYVRREESY